MTNITTTSLLVVALLVFVGGLIGFLKGKSKASVIAGTISGALLTGCYFVASINALNGYIGAFVLLLALDVVFVKRLMKTKAFMPSGMMLLISVIEQIILICAFLNMAAEH
jgi:uncharacterized membrane protein (UPF0136 family)